MITESTGITIGVLLVLVPLVWWAATVMAGLRRDVREIKASVSNAVTLDRAEVIATRMAMKNPGLRVPDPKAPHKDIRVSIDHEGEACRSA